MSAYFSRLTKEDKQFFPKSHTQPKTLLTQTTLHQKEHKNVPYKLIND